MNPDLKELKLRIIIGVICTVLLLGGGKIISDLWTRIVILEHPIAFDKDFDPEPIDYTNATDEDGDDFIEPIFSDEDQEIIDRQDELLAGVSNFRYIYAILGLIALGYTILKSEQYFKAKKAKNTINS